MKKYIKNVTDDNTTVIPALGRPYSSAILSFKENGKKVTLKPGDSVETKLNGTNVSGKRLKLVTEEELKGKKEIKKKEVK